MAAYCGGQTIVVVCFSQESGSDPQGTYLIKSFPTQSVVLCLAALLCVLLIRSCLRLFGLHTFVVAE